MFIYQISVETRPIYIGRAKDVKERLKSHLTGAGSKIVQRVLKDFIYHKRCDKISIDILAHCSMTMSKSVEQSFINSCRTSGIILANFDFDYEKHYEVPEKKDVKIAPFLKEVGILIRIQESEILKQPPVVASFETHKTKISIDLLKWTTQDNYAKEIGVSKQVISNWISRGNIECWHIPQLGLNLVRRKSEK